MFEQVKNKTVMVTGATGLIGQSLVKRLLDLDSKVVAVVRNVDKARTLFKGNERISYIISDIAELYVRPMNVDYIIHAASNTASKAFINDPVGVINTALEGTKRTLEIAKCSDVKGYIYLSSMEIYGTPDIDEMIDEQHCTNINTMARRSAYPESKRMCESLCAAYASQYGVPAKVVRLSQTFGPGVQYDDNRVFAEFARCAIEGRDIILRTKGETKRSYLYTEDATNAILTVLISGTIGEAYNAANEETYCSIYELAHMIADQCVNERINVVIKEEDITKYGYASTLFMNLDTKKIRCLGWNPEYKLNDMIRNLIAYMREEALLQKES